MIMKKIEAIVRLYKLDEVLHALYEIGIKGHSVAETRGYGRQKGHDDVYRGPKHLINYWPKWKIEVVCMDETVDQIVQTIIKAARTGDIGDGKIFVYEVDQAFRIRTGETGADAIKI